MARRRNKSTCSHLIRRSRPGAQLRTGAGTSTSQISTTCPGFSAANRSRANLRFIERRAERDHRRVDRFVGQLKRAVMMRQRLLRAAVAQRLHGILRIQCAGPA